MKRLYEYIRLKHEAGCFWYDLRSATSPRDIQDLDSSVRDADCGVRTGIVREKGSAKGINLFFFSISRDSSPRSPHNRPFWPKTARTGFFFDPWARGSAAARNTLVPCALSRASWTIPAGGRPFRPHPTRACEVSLRDSPDKILPETSSAPAGAKYTVGTGKAIEDAAETFTTESGMVKMPCDHSLIHIHHLFRE